jgi:hypothetical protein
MASLLMLADQSVNIGYGSNGLGTGLAAVVYGKDEIGIVGDGPTKSTWRHAGFGEQPPEHRVGAFLTKSSDLTFAGQ